MTIEHLHPVPHLTTVMNDIIPEIESHLLARQSEIETWLRNQWRLTPAPFHASVDLRNAGFKLAPVDTNLFPAGFNNLNPAFIPLCIQAIQHALERFCPSASQILLIPEDHTRNMPYLESIATLQDILEKAGYEVRIGSLIQDLAAPREIALSSGRRVRLEPLERHGSSLGVAGFTPCMILLNNDLAAGCPPILQGLDKPVVPSLELGWFSRLKSHHFAHYRGICEEFAALVDIDPWFINPLFLECGEIDFMKRAGEECLEKNVATLLDAIQRKYDEYGVDKRPFVVIKADAGSYGMGVMMVHSAAEVRGLNRKKRTRMAATKSGLNISRVILQEGIYSFETWGDAQAVAEPVVYMIDHFVVGGFYRVHTQRGPNENLNAPGMHFEPLAFAEPCITPERGLAPDANPNRFYVYGVIARLALLAAAREAAEIEG